MTHAKRLLFLLLAGLLPLRLLADVKLPAIFTDNMVLQRESEVKLWGTAAPERTVRITTSWDGARHEVPADEQPGICGHTHGTDRCGRVMPAPYAAQRDIMGALQSQLQPDFGQGHGRQQGDALLIQTVGAGSDADAHAARQGGDFRQQTTQTSDGAVGIGKRLKIGHKAPVGIGGHVFVVPALPLCAQRQAAQSETGTGALVVAEQTALARQRAVAVRTGRARVQWNFLHPHAVSPTEPCGQCVPTQHIYALLPHFHGKRREKNILNCPPPPLT